MSQPPEIRDRASRILDRVDGVNSNRIINDISQELSVEDTLKPILMSAKPEIGAVEVLKVTHGNSYRAVQVIKRIITQSPDEDHNKLKVVIDAIADIRRP